MSRPLISRGEIVQLMGAATATPVLAAPTSDICFFTAVEMAGLIRRKERSAREVMAAHLKQIERVNPQVNAIVTLIAEQATANARKADEAQARGAVLGPLHGLPVVHKDFHDTAGVCTTYGSRIFKDNIPKQDAMIVERIAKSGCNLCREEQYSRIWRGLTNLQRSLWRNEESLRSDQDLWRLKRRRRGKPGLWIRAYRRGQR